MSEYLFTSESVSEGHPDKVSDQISDAILDALLAQDPRSRVAAETLCTTGLVLLAGEITSSANIDYIQVARDTVKEIGFGNSIDANDVVASTESSTLSGLAEKTVALFKNIGGENIDVTLRALEKKGVIRTLAEPNLVALSGDTASFLAGG